MKKWPVLAAAALAAVLLASCGDSTSTASASTVASTDTASDTEEVTEELDSLSARKLIDDGLGEYDFGGYEYRVITCDDNGDFIVMDEETGDVVDDAVYTRNLNVEDRFNCKITLVTDDVYTESVKTMTKSITAGEDAFDITNFHVVQLGQIVPSGYFLNWYDIPNIDFSKPWWSSSNTENLTYDGVCIIAIGDFAITAMTQTYCVFYNKKLGADYDFPDLYQVVRDGGWTFDYIVSLTKDIYVDLNQNGAVDYEDDLFGYTSDVNSNIDAYLWAFNNPVFAADSEGKQEYVYPTEKIADIVTKLVSTFNQYDGIAADKSYDPTNNAHGYSRDMFAKGQSVLANGYISMSLTHFRELEDDFGILPYPKWDEAQSEYYTMADGNHLAMAIPKTATNLETIGVITEALCAESYKVLYPAYYDVALKVKSTRDEESIEMLDLVVNSRMFDFGYVYDGWSGASFFLEQLVKAGNTDFASFYAKKEKAVTKYYTKVLTYFEEYQESES